MRNVRKALARRRDHSRRRWLLLLGAGAAGIAGLGLLRRRGAKGDGAALSESLDAVTNDVPGTATGNPVAGLAMTDKDAVRTGTGTPARVEPPLGTTPNGGY